MIAGILDSIRRGCFYCSCAAPQQAFAPHQVIAPQYTFAPPGVLKNSHLRTAASWLSDVYLERTVA
jgi:hypothetical protein